MERKELATIFYGEGRIPYTFATDCPVRFDVWLRFAQTTQKGEKRVDVILDVNEEHGVRRVLDLLRVTPMSNAIAAGSFVVASLTLDELVRVILPMTNLFGVVRSAKSISYDELKAVASSLDADSLTPSPTPTDDGIERMDEQRQHLIWLLKLLVAVQTGAKPPAGKRTAKAKSVSAN
jgi:hypothetical protein